VLDGNGKPLNNTDVCAETGDPPRAVHLFTGQFGGTTGISTDDAGRFKLAGLPTGSYTLHARLRRGDKFRGTATVDVAENAHVRDIVLRDAPAGKLTIEGTVSYPSGLPCPFAVLALSNRKSATAGPLGGFSFTDLDEGIYTVYAMSLRAGCSPVIVPDVQAGTRGLHVKLKDYVILAGTVTDTQTGQPVPDFTVAYRSKNEIPFDTLGKDRGEQAFSDPAGKFRVEKVPAIPLIVDVEASGYVPWTTVLRDPVDGQDNVIQAQLQKPAAITGTVRNEAGQPIASAQISIQPSSLALRMRGLIKATTDATGAFVIESLPQDEQTYLAVSCDGYPSETLRVTPGVDEPIEIVLATPGQVRVRVTRDGQPVQQFHASIYIAITNERWSMASAETENGEALLQNVLPGEVSVSVSVMLQDNPRNRISASTQATVMAGLETEIEVRLPHGASVLEGQVLEDGAPVPTASVGVHAQDASFYTSVSVQADGTFRFDSLPAGEYLLACNFAPSSSRNPMLRQMVTLDGSNSEEVVFQFRTGTGRITGSFTNLSAEARVVVTLHSGDVCATLNAEGGAEGIKPVSPFVLSTYDSAFAFDHLEAGIYTVFGRYASSRPHNGIAASDCQVVQVADGAVTGVVLTLPQ